MCLTLTYAPYPMLLEASHVPNPNLCSLPYAPRGEPLPARAALSLTASANGDMHAERQQAVPTLSQTRGSHGGSHGGGQGGGERFGPPSGSLGPAGGGASSDPRYDPRCV